MVKESFSPEYDQHDAKVFRETLGTFGTTTKPGGNQLQELQAKVRQGVKHVELHLLNSGKGQFGQLDTPDKYGFENRRTIMQLAKLNKQTMSVHTSFDFTSFSGLSRQTGGFDEAERWRVMTEVDETIKFAAETAKQGAIVMHIHEQQLPTSPGDINLPRRYLEWMKNNKDPKIREEYKKLEKEYFKSASPRDKQFVDSPEMVNYDIKKAYEDLSSKTRDEFLKEYDAKIKESGKTPWDFYYDRQKLEKMKVQPNTSPLILVGDQMDKVDRSQDIIDVSKFENGATGLSDVHKNALKTLGIDYEHFGVEEFQKTAALFSNSLPEEYKGKIDKETFYDLKKTLVLDYEYFLKNNNNMASQADEEYYKKFNEMNISLLNKQKTQLQNKYKMFKSELERIKELENENRAYLQQMEVEDESTDMGKRVIALLKNKISEKVKLIEHLKYNYVGQESYAELSKYDEAMAQINRKIRDTKEKGHNVRSLTDEIFDKNIASIAHFGIKAMSYQVDLLKNSKIADEKKAKISSEIAKLEAEYEEALVKDDKGLIDEKNKELNQKRADLRKWVGMKDYGDIDLKDKPLYVAPENMIVGYGYMTNLEEYKAVIRESWQEFVNKITSDDPVYKKIRDDYENQTKIKITKDNALEIAKRHIGGTFDNAHAAVWLKYFKREKNESEEARIERFNKWLNDQAEEMVKEKIVKHVHLNDSMGKDDDHNLLGSGILNIHDLRHRLRKAGIKEPMIIEAGGRGSNTNLHVTNAFDVFNPAVNQEVTNVSRINSGVSDWVNVQRDYQNRPQYSSYGMSYSTFRHVPPQQNQERGGWSGTSFF